MIKPQQQTNSGNTTQQIQIQQQLIGTYSLDPNRCLDLTVDALEYELAGKDETTLPEWNTDRLSSLN